MKNTLKKLGAIALVLMLMMSLSVNAFADNAVLNNGIAGDQNDNASKQENTILILKELKVYNTTGGNIYLPTVGYTYTITSETVANTTTVTDGHAHQGLVYAGDVSALDAASKTVSFSATTTSGYGADGSAATITQPTAAAVAGTSYYGGFTVTVTPDTLGHPGIFRYKITEAEDATNTLAKAGVVHQNDNYQAVRYLDVYVRRAVATDSVSSTYVVYGYVLWTPTSEQNQNTSIPTVTKESGWVGDNGGDEYNTYNLVVTKAITGNLADKNHQFPFQVVFTSPNATAATIHYTATNGTPATQTTATLSSAATTTIGALSNSSALKLKDQGSVTFYGIPAGVTATVQEMNDTYDVYTAKATITANTAQTYTDNAVQAGANATIISNLDNATTTAAVGTADTKTEWTNEMTVVSPTGVVMRVAPYALMLIGGLVLLVISRRRKAEEA